MNWLSSSNKAMSVLQCCVGVSERSLTKGLSDICKTKGRVFQKSVIPVIDNSSKSMLLDTIQVDYELDTRDLPCPVPILATKKKLAQMASGQVLRIRSVDTSSMQAFRGYAKQTGNRLISQEEFGEEFVTVIERR
ncbi:MAG: hypothetical protein MESAZ_02863 [Saezia sanguinis]